MADQRAPATRKDHERFCTTEGWTERTRATGKRGSHHVNYELVLPDGSVLLTRISHPVDRTDYGPSIWAHILRDQLAVTAAEFWACVVDGQVPHRGEPEPPGETIPLWAVQALVHQVHLQEPEVRAMTAAEAIQRVADFYATGQ